MIQTGRFPPWKPIGLQEQKRVGTPIPGANFLYATEGGMVVRSSEGSWVVPSNRALWIKAGLEHEVTMTCEVKIRTVFVDTTAVGSLPPKTCMINVSQLLKELLIAAVKLLPDRDAGSRGDLLIRLIIEELPVSSVLPLHLPFPAEDRVRRICDRIIAEPANAATAEEWASDIGVAAKAVHRIFVKENGMTFAQCRQQARLLHALRALVSRQPVIVIAFDRAYASQSACTAMFKRHFGMPPSVFFRNSAGCN